MAVGRFHLEGALAVIQHRQDVPHQFHGRVLQEIGPFPLRAPPRVIELGARTQQPIMQIGFLRRELIAVGGHRRELPVQGFGRDVVFGRHVGKFLIGLLGVHCH